MTKIFDVVTYLEQWAPPHYQEDFDNSGLIVGDYGNEITTILISLDVTEAVVKEAIQKGANLIIAHHPIVFKGIKKITGSSYVENTLILAIKNDIAIYAIHTNLDHILEGVNWKIGEKLGLQNLKILKPKSNTLLKLTVFVPLSDTEQLLNALFEVGAGKIGNYKNCNFIAPGIGSFIPTKKANPSIGEINKTEVVNENKIEVLVPIHLKNATLGAMFQAHPYEEISYFLTKLENENLEIGSGLIGELDEKMSQNEFLGYLKASMNLKVVKYTPINNQIKKVAVCGGAGSFLLKDAISRKADAFITSDFKYHEFFDSEGKILIADIGHYESEVFTKELIQFYLSNKFTNFATLLSEIDTNPIKYYP